MPGSSQRWPLAAFKQDPSSGQLARLGWPAEQHVLLLALQQVRQHWDTAEGEGTQETRESGVGRWCLRSPEGRYRENTICRERGWEWDQEHSAAAGFGVAHVQGTGQTQPQWALCTKLRLRLQGDASNEGREYLAPSHAKVLTADPRMSFLPSQVSLCLGEI